MLLSFGGPGTYVAFTIEDLLKPADVKNNPNLVIIQSISKKGL